MIDLRYRNDAMIEDLQIGDCTIRPCRTIDGIAWWELWAYVRRDDNGEELTVGVPVIPDGDPREPGEMPRMWGFKRGDTADAWIISPSVNVLDSRVLHPGEHATEVSIWHQNICVVNVPHDAAWIGRPTP